jgi:hypothetical protein
MAQNGMKNLLRKVVKRHDHPCRLVRLSSGCPGIGKGGEELIDHSVAILLPNL